MAAFIVDDTAAGGGLSMRGLADALPASVHALGARAQALLDANADNVPGLRAFALNREQVLKHNHAETACVPRRRRARPVVDNVELAFLLVDEVLLCLVQLCEQALHKHVRYRARIDAYEYRDLF